MIKTAKSFKFMFKHPNKKEGEETKKNAKLFDKLINFCIKHFDDYEGY